MDKIAPFAETVWGFYAAHARDLPWRQPEADGCFSPYKVLLSEVMLQQTQVQRVMPKYKAFLEQFPNISALAAAELGAVLRAWQGLGYNRRAKFLWQAAKMITDDYQGEFPLTAGDLQLLPGVGKETAGAILTYAFDQPVAFIETNVRTVFIHHFLNDADQVTDTELRPYVQATVDYIVSQAESPREFFWALMDYGAHLKSQVGNVSRRSKHYTKQSPFKGSKRQIRGQILRHLTSEPELTAKQLDKLVRDVRVEEVLEDLTREELIVQRHKTYRLA